MAAGALVAVRVLIAMGLIRDLLRFRKQAKELRTQMRTPDLGQLIGAASGTIEEVPELLGAIADAQAEAERLRSEASTASWHWSPFATRGPRSGRGVRRTRWRSSTSTSRWATNHPPA